VNLRFNSLNSLLHTVLTYLRGPAPLIPGGADVPKGTAVELCFTYPEATEPIRVAGTSRGLDPAGRGLRLTLEDPKGLDQVCLILTHLHFGPYVARALFDAADAKVRPAVSVSEPPRVTVPKPEAIAVGMSRSRRQGLDALARERARDLSPNLPKGDEAENLDGLDALASPFRKAPSGGVELKEEPTSDPAVNPIAARASATQLPRLAFVAEMEKTRSRERTRIPGLEEADWMNTTQIVGSAALSELPDEDDDY
jgi:hypothetical protein